MTNLRNEISIYRGESFTLDKILQNPDGSPYIISNQIVNPYFLVSVSNTIYQSDDRYLYNAWLEIPEELRFHCTRPIDLHDIKNEDGSGKYESFADLNGLPSGYIDDVLVMFEKGDAVFWSKSENAYKYWDGTSWKNYEARLIFTIESKTTEEWVEQAYWYSILLVGGMESDEKDDKPLKTIDWRLPILGPTKLVVKSDLKGGF